MTVFRQGLLGGVEVAHKSHEIMCTALCTFFSWDSLALHTEEKYSLNKLNQNSSRTLPFYKIKLEEYLKQDKKKLEKEWVLIFPSQQMILLSSWLFIYLFTLNEKVTSSKVQIFRILSIFHLKRKKKKKTGTIFWSLEQFEFPPVSNSSQKISQ